MDATAFQKTLVFSLLALLSIAVAASPVDALTCGDTVESYPRYGRLHQVFDGSTWYAWHRTWHGPNALETPLNGYYIPRVPGGCVSEDCGDDYGGVDAELDMMRCPTGCGCRRESCYPGMGLEPAGLERLGQIPNDLELSAGMPNAASGGPARTGR
ncbi:MAG: hypothetical protein WD738_18190 [Pirellulales bacterium]